MIPAAAGQAAPEWVDQDRILTAFNQVIPFAVILALLVAGTMAMSSPGSCYETASLSGPLLPVFA